MKKILIVLILAIIFIIFIQLVQGFNASTSSYDIKSFHQGSSGSNATTTSYTFRSTTTFEQGSNLNLTTTNFVGNAGWFDPEPFGPKAISISLSENLSQAILWNITSIPAIEEPAEGNNDLGITSFFVNLSSQNTNVDLYIKANGDFLTATSDVLGLGNETYTSSTTDNTVSSINKFSITKNFADNKIGDNLQNKAVVYLKFFLNVSAGQPAGNYNNTVFIKAVVNGQNP